MMRRVWCAVACFIPACLFPSLDGVGGREDGAVADAASGDAGADADARVGFCASLSPKPTFCDDFDEGGALFDDAGTQLPPWDYGALNDNSTAVLDQTNTRSPPFAMLATVPPQSQTVYPTAFVTKYFGATAQHVVLAADVYIEQTDPALVGTIMSVAFDNGDLRVHLTGGTTTTLLDAYVLPDGGTVYTTIGSAFDLVFHQWMRVTETVDVAANTVEVTIDSGSGPIVVLPATAASQTIGSSSPRANVGLYFPKTANTGWIVHYDNVVINVY